MEGVLPVDKPVGPTSHDIVAVTRRALQTRRIGHTGTLDPFASGLLLLCVGRATRIAEYLTGLAKTYHATLRLGQATDSDDLTGNIIAESDDWPAVTRQRLEDVLAPLRGDILQVPSAFSAKQRDGERAYRAAREGRALSLEAVRVRVDRLELVSCEPPYATIHVTCSSGTYVRALARDIGQALGVGAHLTQLRRTAIGSHRVEDAVTPAELTDSTRVASALIATLDALGNVPRVELDAADATRIRHGQVLVSSHATGTVALVADRELVAIGEADGERIRPRKVFSA